MGGCGGEGGCWNSVNGRLMPWVDRGLKGCTIPQSEGSAAMGVGSRERGREREKSK